MPSSWWLTAPIIRLVPSGTSSVRRSPSARTQVTSAMADPQPGDRAGRDVRPPGDVAEDADAAGPAEDLRQRHPGLDPGQLRAQAGVDPAAEADVQRLGGPADAEPVRVGERAAVAVGRLLDQEHPFPGLDLPAVAVVVL